ncbi:MAG: hypothetical protein SGCHY_005339, partial [Lobulomycetales sp.]
SILADKDDSEDSHTLDSSSREVRFQPDLANNGLGGQAVRAAPHLPSRRQSVEANAHNDESILADKEDSEDSHTLDSSSREVRFQPELANPARRVTFGENSERTYYPAVEAAHSLQAPSNQIDYTDDDSVARFQPDLANNGLGVDAVQAAPPHLPTRRQSMEADEDNGDEESIEADEEGSHSLDSGSREVRFQPDLANNGLGGQAVREAPPLPTRRQSVEADEDSGDEASIQ